METVVDDFEGVLIFLIERTLACTGRRPACS